MHKKKLNMFYRQIAWARIILYKIQGRQLTLVMNRKYLYLYKIIVCLNIQQAEYHKNSVN